MTRKLFVNLPVQNLDRSIRFFEKLGFSFDPQFTDERAACMVVSGEACVMLLTRQFFASFTERELCDASSHTEGIFALSCQSPEEVDELVNTAIAAGGRHAMQPMDRGFMYGWSFYDLDGHHWEVLWMDPRAVQN